MTTTTPTLRPDDLAAHAAWARTLARALLADPHAADDAVQETWLAALESPPATDRPVRPWLATVLRNAARKGHRSRVRRTAREEQAARPEALHQDPADVVARLETQRRVTEAVHALAEPYRTAILLRFMEGLSPSEIAQRRGIPAATVRSHVHRGLALLRDELDRRTDGNRRAWALPLVALATHAPRRRAPWAAWIVVCTAIVLAGGALWWAGGGGAPPAGHAGDVAGEAAEGAGDPASRAGVDAADAVGERVRRHVDRGPNVTSPDAGLDAEGGAPGDEDAGAESATDEAWTELVIRFVDPEGRPLVGVRIDGDDAPPVLSDEAGRARVRITDVAEDELVHVRASASGRASRTVSARAAPGGEVLVGDVALGPGGAIEGRVTDATGKALERIFVVATADEVDVTGTLGGGSASTDDEGAFRIEGVPVGTVLLWIEVGDGPQIQLSGSSTRRGALRGR